MAESACRVSMMTPLLNIINPRTRELIQLAPDIVGYTDLIPGTPLRVSTKNGVLTLVLPENTAEQTRTDIQAVLAEFRGGLLDESKMYHAVYTGNTLVLTHVVPVLNDPLGSLDPLDPLGPLDLGSLGPFDQRAQFTPCLPEEVIPLREAARTKEFGITFLLASGLTIECWSQEYRFYRMWEKPGKMRLEMYYVLMLNKQATGLDYDQVFADVHADVQDYLRYFPEHAGIMAEYTDVLREYARRLPEPRETALLEFVNRSPEVIFSHLWGGSSPPQPPLVDGFKFSC